MSKVWLVWQDELLHSVWHDEGDARYEAARVGGLAVCSARVRTYRTLRADPVEARYLEEEQEDQYEA